MENVRRDLLRLLPVFSRVYHLAPWDVEKLTAAELEAFADDLDKLADAQEQATVDVEKAVRSAVSNGAG